MSTIEERRRAARKRYRKEARQTTLGVLAALFVIFIVLPAAIAFFVAMAVRLGLGL